MGASSSQHWTRQRSERIHTREFSRALAHQPCQNLMIATANLIASRYFIANRARLDERFTQRALYGSSFHTGSLPEQGIDELQTTRSELNAEQGLEELRLTTSKALHQNMLYTPHRPTLVLPVTMNILQRRSLSGRLFEKLCHSPAETIGSLGS